MSDASLKKITKNIIAFRDARNWKQFHTPKDIALALVVESAEAAELFQFKTAQELKNLSPRFKEKLGDELSDVLYWVLLAAHDFGIDLVKAQRSKMKDNERKYPVAKSRGKNRKYNE